MEHAYAGPANRLVGLAQPRREREGLNEQYALLFWHYLRRAVRSADEVEFALMEADCLKGKENAVQFLSRLILGGWGCRSGSQTDIPV